MTMKKRTNKDIEIQDKSFWNEIETERLKAKALKETDAGIIPESSTTIKKIPILDELIKASKLFRPEFRYVLAKKIAPKEKKSAGGIIMAGQKEAKLSHTNKACIVVIGEKAFEWKPKELRPKLGDIVHFTRYEDFIIDHSSEYLDEEDGGYCTIYDEYIVLTEINQPKGE